MPTISNHSWTPKHGKSPVISFITQFLIDFRVITFTEEDNPEGVFLNIVDDAVVASLLAGLMLFMARGRWIRSVPKRYSIFWKV
jgi:hypothetical protein